MEDQISDRLINKIREGRLQVVKELIGSYGLSYSKAWSDGYVLLRNAIEYGRTEITKLLLKSGCTVNKPNRKPSNTALHLAVRNGDIEIVELLLGRSVNVNVINKHNITPLHESIENGKIEIIALLLSHGADVNARDENSITPLHIASEKGSEQVVKFLLVNGADSNAINKYNLVPLHIAIKNGHQIIVKLLLEHGTNVKVQDKAHNSILHFAIHSGYNWVYKNISPTTYETIVKLLLEHGAYVDAEDKYGKTVLCLAVEKRCSMIIISHILKYCPDVSNKSNRSSLNIAVCGNGSENRTIIKKLLKYGFNVDLEDISNNKLKHVAIKKGHLEFLEEILNHGADVNILYNFEFGKRYTLLHAATKENQEEVATLLIKYGAEVNAKDRTGKLPIFYAINNSNLKMIKLLFANGANVKDSVQPLSVAVQMENKEIVELLLQHDADIYACDELGRTALHFTAIGEYMVPYEDSDVKGEIAKLLLSRGANVNAQDTNGTTVLHEATRKRYAKLVEALLEYDVNVNLKEKNDKTPLHICALNGNAVINTMLLNKGANVDAVDEKDGITALHIAAKKGNLQIVVDLLEYGADINIMSKNNESPLDYAYLFITNTGFKSFCDLEKCGDPYEYNYDYVFRIIDDCQEIMNILQQHILKMKIANLYVSEENLRLIEIETGILQNKYMEEIKCMKSEKIGDNKVAFCDFLTEDVSQLANYLQNESVVQVLKSDDYKTKFPIYASMIKAYFRKGMERKELLEQNTFLYSLFHKLPYECTEKIFSYLNNNDLRSLIDSRKCHY